MPSNNFGARYNAPLCWPGSATSASTIHDIQDAARQRRIEALEPGGALPNVELDRVRMFHARKVI
jgi:hypothetical protein